MYDVSPSLLTETDQLDICSQFVCDGLYLFTGWPKKVSH